MSRRARLLPILGRPKDPNTTTLPNLHTDPSVCAGPSSLSTPQEASQSKTYNHALELAINRHLHDLPQDKKEAFRRASQDLTEENLLLKVRERDEHHKKNSHFRPKAEALSQALSLLNRFMAGVTIGIQANPDAAAIVVGGVRVVLDLAINFVEFFTSFSEMLCRLGDYLAPLARYATSATRDELILETLANIYGDLLRFCAHAHAVFTRGGARDKWTSWRIFLRVQWRPFEKEFRQIELLMQHHLQVLNHAAQATGLNATEQVSRRDIETREKERATEREHFLNWMSDIPFEKTHDNIVAEKHPETGGWLIQHSTFQNWMNSHRSALLWCNGNPGAGKSVLASHVVEHITAHHAPRQEVGLCFVYYSYKAPELQDVALIIAALIKQLCRKRDVVPPSFLRAKQDSLHPSTVGSQHYFNTIAQEFEEVFLVIDGLDECPQNARFHALGFIEAVLAGLTKVKLFVTSRRETDITRAFEGLTTPTLEIKTENTSADISKYATEEVGRLRAGYCGKKLHVKSPALEHKIVETLIAKADGMFLWVKLQIDSLCRISECRRDSEVEKALDGLPVGLYEVYIRALDQVDHQLPYMKALAYKTLMWVVYAKRLLSIDELSHAFAAGELCETGEVEVDSAEVILGACANMLVQAKATVDGVYQNSIQPAHYSVQEFLTHDSSGLLTRQTMIESNGDFFVHTQMALACLTYLRHHITERAMEDVGFRVGRSPFLHYAACYFDHHILDCETLSDELRVQILEFLEQDAWFLAAFLRIREYRYYRGSPLRYNQTEIPEIPQVTIISATDVIYTTQLCNVPDLQDEWRTLPPSQSVLHRACFSGLAGVVDQILADVHDANVLDGAGISPIYYAASQGHESVVGRLLENGARGNAGAGRSGTALQVACQDGRIGIVRLLLSKGVDVNAREGDQNPALWSALYNGYAEILQLLIDKGADVQASNYYGQTALNAALQRGHLNIVSLLIKTDATLVNVMGMCHKTGLYRVDCLGHIEVAELLLAEDADISMADNDGVSPLTCASGASDGVAVRMLLEKGAEVNPSGDLSETPLHAASFANNKAAVEILLDHGANINTQISMTSERHFYRGYTALHVASEMGAEDVVQLLLSRGARAELQDDQGQTALHLASITEQISVVKLLLTSKIDIHLKDVDSRNALHVASEMGAEDVVQLLLSRGARAELQDDQGRTALHLALITGQIDVIKLLLTSKINIYLKDVDGRNALHIASEMGAEDVVELLLSRGARVELQDDRGRTALHLAEYSGEMDVAKLLLTSKIDVHLQDVNAKTALHAASRARSEGIVQSLLLEGASVEAQDFEGRTALHQASGGGDVNMVKRLLSAGANVEAQDSKGRTALHLASRMGGVNVVERLLSDGASVETQDSKGRTALHLASRIGGVNVVERLLIDGANVEAQDFKGRTALHQASGGGDVNVVKLLLDWGSEIGTEDACGDNALHLVSKEMGRDVADLLLSKGAKIDAQNTNGQTVLSLTCGTMNDDMQWYDRKWYALPDIEFWLSRGANTEIKDSQGRTALHVASTRRAVELLLSWGANIEARDLRGQSALSLASKKEEKGMVDLLLSKGASAEAEDSVGRDPSVVQQVEAERERGGEREGGREREMERLGGNEEELPLKTPSREKRKKKKKKKKKGKLKKKKMRGER